MYLCVHITRSHRKKKEKRKKQSNSVSVVSVVVLLFFFFRCVCVYFSRDALFNGVPFFSSLFDFTLFFENHLLDSFFFLSVSLPRFSSHLQRFLAVFSFNQKKNHSPFTYTHNNKKKENKAGGRRVLTGGASQPQLFAHFRCLVSSFSHTLYCIAFALVPVKSTCRLFGSLTRKTFFFFLPVAVVFFFFLLSLLLLINGLTVVTHTTPKGGKKKKERRSSQRKVLRVWCLTTSKEENREKKSTNRTTIGKQLFYCVILLPSWLQHTRERTSSLFHHAAPQLRVFDSSARVDGGLTDKDTF